MPVRRASQSLLAISSQGKKQPDFATLMQADDLDFLFPDTAKTFYKKDQTREDQLDCSGQELFARILLGEIGDISVSFDVTPKLAAIFAVYTFGVAASPAATVAAPAVARATTTGNGTIGAHLVVGGLSYTISADGLGTHEISVGSSPADFASKIAARVTTDTSTTLCTAAAVGAVITFTRNANGSAGNGAPFSTTDTLITINHGFQGGLDAGAPYTHALSELPLDVFQGPPFSMAFGFRGADTALMLRGCTINTLSFTSKARNKITAQANIKFAEGIEVDDFVFPVCDNELALRFQDLKLSVDGSDQAALLRSADFTYDLKLVVDEHAFTDQGILASRLERDDRRDRKLNYAILGDNSDAVYLAAEAGDQQPIVLTIGPAGDQVVFTAGNVQRELDGGGLAKDGSVAETNIKIAGMPMMDGASLPMSAEIINSQSTAYLVASV